MAKKTKRKRDVLTTAAGAPVDNDQNSLIAGDRGPVLMQDLHLMEKLAHFNRERIPERVVHAKGAGAGGYFAPLIRAYMERAKAPADVGIRVALKDRLNARPDL